MTVQVENRCRSKETSAVTVLRGDSAHGEGLFSNASEEVE